MSKLQDRRTRKDHFHQRARRAGYRARSVFKLEEIDRKIDLFAPGQRVVDLGCNPGSWLQYARDRVGHRGALVGIDRTPLDLALPNLVLHVGDVFETEPSELLGELDAFDVVLSDMAPDTTGVKQLDQARSELLFERALDIAAATLAPGGHFVGKLFQGPEFQALIKRCRATFERVKIIKPAGSRSESIEQYITAKGWRG